ncbi:hypothetical protein BDZ45DRAFT_806745 [Acephala macrosclerotiorum]|nr:hypothetical protein BDZ45DRAFT_806745 [Acephala macrosclerotiorum]
MDLSPTEQLYRAQYADYRGARPAAGRRPLPQATISPVYRHTTTPNEQFTSHEFGYFHLAAREHKCKSYKLHRNLRGRAVAKDAQLEHRERRENRDWNYVFPPSVIERHCNAAIVQELLNCDCRICGSFDVDLSEDVSLISDVEDDLEVRFSIAVLAYMGASFAIRSLYKCGLGKSGFSLSVKLDSVSLKEEMFNPLQKEPKIPEFQQKESDRPLEHMALDFNASYEETRMLLRSPKLEANMTTTALQGCNLPFLKERSLDPRTPHKYPHVSILSIHPEYRDASVPTGQLVRKKLQRASGIIDESAGDEKNILKFIAGMDRKNIIKLCFWFTYDNTINLVFPKYPGTLEDVLLEKWGPSRRSQFSSKFRGSRLNHWLWEEAVDIVGALDYIHNPGIFNGENVIMAHFDLKPANILVDEEGHLVITDFGIARIKSLANGDTTKLVAGAGTLTYAPPEGNKVANLRLSRAYDIWSMGCILLEIILFVLYDKGPRNNTSGVELFAKARLEEGERRRVQFDYSFWMEKRNGVSLKDCVDQRLKQVEKSDDAYMKRAGKELRNFMLNTAASARHPAKTCYDLLKEDDPSLARRGVTFSGGQILAVGEHTESPIHQMSVFFDSKDPKRLSHPSVDCQLRCFLIRSSNQKRDKCQVVMKYESNECQQERSDCGYISEEEFVPISSYVNPRIPGTPFQFRLSSIHPQIAFKFNDERDFFRVQAAFTRQQVRVPTQGLSNLPIKRCWFKRSGIFKRNGPFDLPSKLKASGCVQIWDQLSEQEYRDSVIPDNPRLSGSSSGSGSNSTGSSFHLFRSPTRVNTNASTIQDAAPKQSTQVNPTRIAIFLCSEPDQGQDLTLITLNMAYLAQDLGSEHICEDKNNPEPGNYEACVTFNTLPGHKSFNAGCFREITKGDVAGTRINISPGIPLDPMALHNKEQDEGTPLKWLELEFNTKEDRENFQRRVKQSRLEPYGVRIP